MNRSLCALLLTAVALSACARSGPPAPVDIRGVGAGEVRPGVAGARTGQTTPEPMAGSTYTPPPGYGSRTSIQAQTLGEPDDAYAQSSTMTPRPTPAQDATQPPPPSLGGPPVTPTTTTPPVTATPEQDDGSYDWPLRGRILKEYSKSQDGTANEGLNIAAPQGTAVLASRTGTVAYASNELRNFGNTVLLRHPGGYFTVYAHLDQMSVTKGQVIAKGQTVGTVGQTGGVAEPQLHFEVRKDSTPLDPRKFLRE